MLAAQHQVISAICSSAMSTMSTPVTSGISLLNVYNFERIPIEDRLDIYADEMLLDARCSAVESAVIGFVAENIEPVGWRAVWRSTPASSELQRPRDFVVEVQDVSQRKLEATVQVVGHAESFMTKLMDTVGDDDTVESVDEETTAPLTLINRIVNVPLLELYPVYDESTEEQFMRTAEVIEHVRFFYKYLWYSWDDEDEDDCIFAKRYLKPRMKLYEDIKNGILSTQDVECYHSLSDEARQLHQKLEALATEMGASDSESELNENDVLACIELRKKQDELKRKLLYMESPVLRSLMMKKEHSVKPSSLGRRPGGETVTHVVAEKLLAIMCKSLQPNTVVEHHTTFTSAIAAAYDGDTIQVYDGVYACDALGWLDDSITIEGKGSSPEDVVLEARAGNGGGDIVLNCSAHCVRLSNLTVRNIGDRRYVMIVHAGHTLLNKCHVIFGDSLVGISVRSAAELTMENCRLGPASGCAVDIKIAGKATYSNMDFDQCSFKVAQQYDEMERDEIQSNMGAFCKNDQDRQGTLLYPSGREIHEVLVGLLEDVITEDPLIMFSQ